MKTTSARFAGKCKCGAKTFPEDRVSFSQRKIVACEACGNFGPMILDEQHGLGWCWAVRLGNDTTKIRAVYRALRAAYLKLPMAPEGPATVQSFVVTSYTSEASKRGIVGRRYATAAEFDLAMKEDVSEYVKDWGGCDEFDRLTVAQLFALAAVYAYERSACGVTWIGPSPETLEWGGFLGGERLNFAEDGHPTINATVRKAFGLVEAESDAAQINHARPKKDVDFLKNLAYN